MSTNPINAIGRLKAALSSRTATFGMIATIPSIQSVQALASGGLDWILIDMEHGPIDMAAAHAMITATAGTRTVPLVRIASQDPALCKAVMDLGVLGVCFPMVCDRTQAEAIVRAVRYPPAGGRLWGPFYAPMRWAMPMQEYIAAADDAMLAIATIEHPDAVKNIEEIVAVPGLDLAFIGPGDLATSLGIPGQFEHPRFKEAVAHAEAAVLRSNVALGGVARTPQQAREMLDRGYATIVYGFDWLLLQQGIRTFLEQARVRR
jgi:4-hydroxy-2-oxoheptanedioate aldolase